MTPTELLKTLKLGRALKIKLENIDKQIFKLNCQKESIEIQRSKLVDKLSEEGY